MTKDYLVSWKRFVLIAVLLMVIFFTFMILFYLKADEITKHPCSICAEESGNDIICTPLGSSISRTFYFNGSIEETNLNDLYIIK